jgi:hypothetical protein
MKLSKHYCHKIHLTINSVVNSITVFTIMLKIVIETMEILDKKCLVLKFS